MKKNHINTMRCMTGVLTGAILLVGCGNRGSDSQEQTVIENFKEITDRQESEAESESGTAAGKEEQQQETQSSTEENVPENDKNDDDSINDKIPQIAIGQKTQNWYTDDNEVLLLEESYSTVKIVNDGFENLASSLSRWSEEQITPREELLESAKDHYDTVGEKELFTNYYSDETISIGRIDSNIISLIGVFSEYSGGAHGMYGTAGYTYDVESGQELSLADLLTDEEAFYDAATEYITNALYEEFGDGLFPDYQKTVEDHWTGEYGITYYLDASGIVIVYNPYDVGPYAMGEAHVTLPYGEFGAYINERYLPSKGGLVAHVPQNKDISAFLGTSGMLKIEVVENDDEFNGITLISGTDSHEISECEWFKDAYVIRPKEGKSLLAISADYASDDYVTFVYDIADNSLQKCFELNGARITGQNLGNDRIELEMHLNVLGTYASDMLYAIEPDGTLTQTEELFQIAPSVGSFHELTLIKELPVTVNNENATLPKGSVITITSTNNVDTAYFKSDDGTEGAISYTFNEEEWTHYIDGISEYEYFEMIPYAG